MFVGTPARHGRCPLALLAMAAIGAGCGGADATEGEGGPVPGQVTVVFAEGTTPARVDDLNAQIGAEVLRSPVFSTWYRIRLPAELASWLGCRFYEAQPDVVACMVAVELVTD